MCSPAAGLSAARIPSISAPIRSPESVATSAASRRIAAAVAASIVKLKRVAKRAARSMRSASSRKRSPASPTARSSPAARSAAPPNGSTREPEATGSPCAPEGAPNAMALMVKSRRARSPSIALRKVIASGRRASLLGPSARKVVTSRTPADVGIPTVPNRFSYCAFGNVLRSWSGVASVARSQSDGALSASVSRTAPPTTYAAKPAALSWPMSSATSSGTAARSAASWLTRRSPPRPLQ